MLYDAKGNIIKDTSEKKPVSGLTVQSVPNDRESYDVSRGLTPYALDQILTSANDGDTAEQCRLAAEILEKNWDIFQAIQTRQQAVFGVKWTIEPGDDSAAAKKAAEAFEADLKNAGKNNDLDSFDNLREDLMDVLLPGFAVSEIAWGPGGGIAGFSFIEQRHFHFRDGKRPKLVTTNEPNGVDLPSNKYIMHILRRRGSDPARGGLIRPLAWLHCFANVNIKDLLRFVERYGMPFAMAKVDKDTWDNERDILKAIIRNFGPDGGGVFTRSTEFELLQAANNKGEVYFDLLKYLADAITKVVLGQTATSGDGGGWSTDSAQGKVRQDILEYDCTTLMATINDRLSAPWAAFNYPNVAAPVFTLHFQPPEDTKALADTVKILFDAGFEADETEMSEKFGIKLKRKSTVDSPQSTVENNTAPGRSQSPSVVRTPDSAALAADGNLTPENAVKAIDGPNAAILDASGVLGAVDKWLSPVADAIAAAANEPDDAKADALIRGLGSEINADTEAAAELIAGTVYAGTAAGIAAAATRINGKAK